MVLYYFELSFENIYRKFKFILIVKQATQIILFNFIVSKLSPLAQLSATKIW